VDARTNRAAAGVGLACLAGLLACQEPSRPPDRSDDITPWFRLEYVAPRLEIPHLLRLGPEERGYALRSGAWRLVYEGPQSYATPLEGGAAVVIRSRAEIHAADSERVVQLPRSDCGGAWYEHVLVVADLARVLCVQASSERGCGRLRIAQFDRQGRCLRRDELVSSRRCFQVRRNEDFNSHLVAGVTPDGDPVVVAQVGTVEGGRPTYVVVVLEAGGARELGRFTAVNAQDTLGSKHWTAVYGATKVLDAR
jgi:hypothetical protein